MNIYLSIIDSPELFTIVLKNIIKSNNINASIGRLSKNIPFLGLFDWFSTSEFTPIFWSNLHDFLDKYQLEYGIEGLKNLTVEMGDHFLYISDKKKGILFCNIDKKDGEIFYY